MLHPATHVVARPLIRAWLSTSPHSWERHVVATDSPHLHAPGTDPDRVLIVGDGAATGRGVRTHELGLPGHLARSLTALTGRATDVDIVVDGRMTARQGPASLVGVDLARFDAVVLSFGANEALALIDVDAWRDDLSALLDDVAGRAPAATTTFVLAVPSFGSNPHFPARLGRVVDRNAVRLNTATRHLVADRPSMVFVPEAEDHAFETESAPVYARWAAPIALNISGRLDPARPLAVKTVPLDEPARQRALERLERRLGADDDPELDDLTERARRLFGTTLAAVTLVRSDTQVMRSVAGAEPLTVPRPESFCDTTIRRTGHLVIEDASLDSRYADYSVVAGEPGIRFYAGYPIESPDGQRIGALCVMDQEARRFSTADATALRSLALAVQRHLFRHESDDGRPVDGEARLHDDG
ncbi:GAF domain-containing protein [Frigoribacterium sp. VKM Ac-1396]|uniref:GAF domain-containing protein n=1 Tax=Frigoribacterium sp. VKM Ac-1396 TaxID=2783821 RepID=UPI00188A1D80|nr:GAF domain-containing protein [Frigoribacterium sp. VKM Ac-1396]MBF4600399.1 GAF domain-containing protein [Frigoribacterium sp. VKM Ac-1396]